MKLSQYQIKEQVSALAIAIFISFGGALLTGIFFGFQFPSLGRFKGYRWKPIIKVLQVPSLTIMIILGCLSRNYIGGIMNAYPLRWTVVIKSICLSILLTRSGLLMNIRRNYFTVAALSIIPQICEVITIALISYGLFKMPITLCFTLGYSIACLGPSVMIPVHLYLNGQGYGKDKAILSQLIVAGIFEDTHCIIFFGICQTIAYYQNSMQTTQSYGLTIGLLFVDNLIGIAVGILLGLSGLIFRCLCQNNLTQYIKLCFVVICCIGIGVSGEESSFINAKYITSLTFGITLQRTWGQSRPINELKWFQWCLGPIYFSSVGGAVNLSAMRQSDIGYGVVCIMSGLVVRLLTVIQVSQFSKVKFNFKEKLFMAISWIPKTAVLSTQGSAILNDAIDQNNTQMIEYGKIIQTISVLSIIITAPIGAILINTLGPLLLQQKNEQQQDTAIEIPIQLEEKQIQQIASSNKFQSQENNKLVTNSTEVDDK
ncbi:mitochondrial sodium hydrogen exchanger 9b2 [Stylonychia lemnae]|uniref:Mitochondrial sodium hydrogen exchanger 9b2 n=1 Tax=Stylonychia lemnae TaxID=5949 RepID=A0A078B413_STYLE|nr:mitochondrial sodium hydrogen exchanger 9b2 [Stylonychia lemnae]|eukprot:CDW88253.1 mitochondrial sodium hydrogen exchanger 9b2 [Stylonychia lemnae]